MDKFDLKKYLSEGKINEEEMDLSYTELSDDEKDEVSDMMDVIYSKINPKGDMKKNTGLFRYIDAWFESKGDRLSRLNEQLDLSSREYSAKKLFALIARDLKFSQRVEDDEMLDADEALEIMKKVIEIEASEISPEAALGEYIANGEL